MDFGKFDVIDDDSSLRGYLHEVRKDYFLFQQHEEANRSHSDAKQAIAMCCSKQ